MHKEEEEQDDENLEKIKEESEKEENDELEEEVEGQTEGRSTPKPTGRPKKRGPLQRISDPAPNFKFVEEDADDGEERKDFGDLKVNTENPVTVGLVKKEEVEKKISTVSFGWKELD